MPKRGSRRRGGGGGRGGHKGRIGGGSGSFNKKKLRGNKRKSPRSSSTQYGELMDDDNIYIPTNMTELASSMGRRKYARGHLLEEIAYTESHHDDLMLRKLRDRPVEFVKAKEVYDPNIILYKLAKQNHVSEVLDVGVQSISLEDTEEEEPLEKEQLEEEQPEEEEQPRKTVDDVVREVQGYTGESDSEEDWNEDELDELISGKLDELEQAVNEMSEDEEEGDDFDGEEEDEDEEQYEAGDDDKDAGDQAVDASEPAIEPLDIIIDLPSTKVESHKSKPVARHSTSASPEPPSEPEYGFLEEDYEFDVSKIEVTNVRFGITNQYHLKCHELTGLPVETDEFIWIDEPEVIDYALSNGVKSHRLNKFLSFITKGMIDEQEPESEPDVYISDSDSDSGKEDIDPDQDDYQYDLDDNLEDLIAYSKSSTQGLIPFSDRDFSRNTPAKHRRTFDDLEYLDPELQDSLTRQLTAYRSNKKQQRHARDEQRLESAILHNDMLIKYPVSITIRQIRSEFEAFLKDESRETLSFPTLDTHGHKTIQRMADCYHMSVLKQGKLGTRKFLRIVKNKGTFKNFPNYEGVDRIMRGRPIFHRIDQKPAYAKKGDKKNPHKSRGGDVKTRFKEGDVVGAEAPEIGESNLGRQMLQKLGWVLGQGLGVDGNKGINQPIVAKVKTSKTGIK
ncbi:Protein SQS1 [Candida viswanathii]|uniref:Protein SQS1 n=1 Tax=Candida viswanathii TaxID=5486 RepID=A0A367Y9M5_9ASCO|nr:Protein SQS1 [Candida viswanathii]